MTLCEAVASGKARRLAGDSHRYSPIDRPDLRWTEGAQFLALNVELGTFLPSKVKSVSFNIFHSYNSERDS